MKRTEWAAGCLLAFATMVACGGSSTSDGAGGTSSGGTGASSTGGASGGSGGATGGSGGATGGSAGSTGGAAGACGAQAKACTQPTDCVLNSPSCCLCGLPELSDFEAINSSFIQACSCQGPACGCATQENPNLAATCEAGACAGFDVRLEDDFSGCTTEADCTLRLGLGCCEACQGDYNLVAVKVDGTALADAVCGDNPIGCPDCAPQYPANKKAACVANHCQVVDK